MPTIHEAVVRTFNWESLTGRIAPLLPTENTQQEMVKALLANGDMGIETASATQIRALQRLWTLSLAGASYGIGSLSGDEFKPDVKIGNGWNEYLFPPVPSRKLIDAGILSEKKVGEIAVTERRRRQRGKGPAENRVRAKALGPEELSALGLDHLQDMRPVLELNETHTIPVWRGKGLELDRISRFVFFRDPDQKMCLLFLGETQIPHAPYKVFGAWRRWDENTPGFFIPPEIKKRIPLPKNVETPVPATPKQIATLLFLICEGVRERGILGKAV